MAKLSLKLRFLTMTALAIIIGTGADAAERVTREIAGSDSVWLGRSSNSNGDLNLDFVPNPPEHGPLPGSNPPLLEISRSEGFRLWLRLDNHHYYLARSGSLATLDPLVASASKATSGGEWVCVHGDQRSRHRELVALLRHLRSLGYPKVCLVSWVGDPGAPQPDRTTLPPVQPRPH